MSLTHKKKGGKVLGKGSFGCAISPAIMCSSKMKPTDKISKIINLNGLNTKEVNELDEEYKLSQQFKKIDPNSKYFLGGVDKCRIPSMKIDRSDLKSCNITIKKVVPLLNIIMKKGKDFHKVANKLSDKDLLKSIAHLLNGAKKSVYGLGIVLLDVKHLNLLYVNSETEKNKIHPVFIDFSPEFVPQSKKEFREFFATMGPRFYQPWPLEMIMTLYTIETKLPLGSRYKVNDFDNKSEMLEYAKKERKYMLNVVKEDIKSELGIDIIKNKKEMYKLYSDLKHDISKNYEEVMDKIMVYSIARSFAHLGRKRPEFLKIITPMLYPEPKYRLTISESLKMISKEIGSVKEKDLLISHKKLTVLQRIRKFVTKPVKNGKSSQSGGSYKNLTKKELLIIIKKNEKTTIKKSKLSMANKKNDLVKYLNDNVPRN